MNSGFPFSRLVLNEQIFFDLYQIRMILLVKINLKSAERILRL